MTGLPGFDARRLKATADAQSPWKRSNSIGVISTKTVDYLAFGAAA